MKRASVNLDGRELVLETGHLARQADGAVLVRMGETAVLVTAVAETEARESLDFFPLTVEYREKYSAAGRFPGGYIKRERRSSDHEILCARLIDRSIRPLFPKTFRSETQVVATVMSYDPDAEPGPLAIIGASAALHLSEIPWAGPVAGLRVARVGGKFLALPRPDERRRADLDIVATVGPEGLVMLEGSAHQVPEKELIEAFAFAEDWARPLLQAIEGLRAEAGAEKRPAPPAPERKDLEAAVRAAAEEPLRKAFSIPAKRERGRALAAAGRAAEAAIAAGHGPESAREVRGLVEALERELIRMDVATGGPRIDGRGPEDVRPISIEAGFLPRAHGSAVFTRGETQAVVTCTLGGAGDAQEVETLAGGGRDRFLLHYNFPPYSVGEVSPLRGPGRREIGHGELARRALEAVLPLEETFPYVIRIDSEITESNGSSSMATVCGGTLALMDAGVPIGAPVAGIAMGLIREDTEVVVLSDILGEEDHLGDMDFKVAGTERGVTAVQLDNKIGSLPRDVLAAAFDQARRGRVHILAEMAKALPAPRAAVSTRAPHMVALAIRPERIRTLIGPGGKTIQEIQATHGVKVDIGDDGRVRVTGANRAAADNAARAIRRLTDDPEVGKAYRATVVSVKEFGIFVRIMAGTEGLVHVSELAEERVESAGDLFREGDTLVVKVLGADRQGRIRLSRKAALGTPEAEVID